MKYLLVASLCLSTVAVAENKNTEWKYDYKEITDLSGWECAGATRYDSREKVTYGLNMRCKHNGVPDNDYYYQAEYKGEITALKLNTLLRHPVPAKLKISFHPCDNEAEVTESFTTRSLILVNNSPAIYSFGDPNNDRYASITIKLQRAGYNGGGLLHGSEVDGKLRGKKYAGWFTPVKNVCWYADDVLGQVSQD